MKQLLIAASKAASGALVFGSIYLIDCRINSSGLLQMNECYSRALPIMGIAVGYKAGEQKGYWTVNPALNAKRKEEHES